MNRQPLIIIAGATAVGKTDLSLKLASSVGGEIISADSMQVYKGFDIGTAKIRPQEMNGICHHMIDILEPDEEFNVYEFKSRAVRCMEQIYSRGKIPIITGGTGFYIQSVLYDVEFTDVETDLKYRQSLELLASEKGPSYLHQMLLEVDPDAASQIHANNIKRTIRALEYHHETGGQISKHNEEQRSRKSGYNHAYFVLNRSRDVIYDRIEQRVDQMISDGLVEEVESLLNSGISPDSLAMQGLGYKEIVLYLKQELSLEEAVSLLKKSTRHFAKRQITWFKREKDAIWINYEDYGSADEMLEQMLTILKEKEIVPLP